MSRPVLLIAGGSRGIGAATAKLAAGNGYDVAVNYKTNSNAAAAVVEAVKKAGGYELDEIAIALIIFCEEYKMVGAFGVAATALMAVRRYIHFAPDDGLDPMRGGLVIEICRGEEVAVVRYGYGGHSAARGLGG